VLVYSGSVVLAASKGSSSAGIVNLIFLLLIVGAVILFMRRGRSRQRAAVETRQNVAPGVEVITTAGLVATVVEGDDETVTLEIAPGVHSKFLRQAIARVVVPPSPEADEPVEPIDPLPDSTTDHTTDHKTDPHPDDAAPPEGTH